jgi:putative PIN family toxin of toxin-antitoxin system
VITAVLDTNVLASGFAGYTTPTSVPGELVRRWRNEEYTLVVSEPILEELARAFANSYFRRRLTFSEIHDAFARLYTSAQMQLITAQVAGVAAHSHDDAIIATAVSAQAPYLVTGDRQLLARKSYRGTEFVTPRQFLAVLGSRSTPEPKGPED